MFSNRLFSRSFSAYGVRNIQTASAASPALSAFGARVGLEVSQPALERAVTHKSFGAVNNAQLEILGKRVAGLFCTEYLRSPAFDKVLTAYIGNNSLAKYGREIGLQHVLRWDAAESEGAFHSETMSSALNAIIGLVHQEKGAEAAKKFVHAHILARDVNVSDVVKIENPKAHLSRLTTRYGKEKPLSRLLKETGRATNSAVFIVGVFSGEEKLGEGYGNSMKMAEYRACMDAINKHYLFENKDFMLPSDTLSEAEYKPVAFGDTQVIV
ncbi:ribonuclease III domain-containing protein [Umbelopsis sp. AD052]|nr:ribonuclease III domain-containing protein [Umbelopsis sp. AD052]